MFEPETANSEYDYQLKHTGINIHNSFDVLFRYNVV